MFEYWPWWLSALALATLAVAFILTTNRRISGSGNWARVILRHDYNQIIEDEAPFKDNPEILKNALIQATIDEFGDNAVSRHLVSRNKANDFHIKSKNIINRMHTPWTVHMSFLTMLIVGGFTASVISGHFEFRPTLGELHTSLFGNGISYWISLISGGFLVGFGTQLASGCSFSHGLGGCPRFESASIIATLTFFLSAIVSSIFAHYIMIGTLQ